MSEHSLFLDVETLPAPESYRAEIEVSPPGSMTKPETIAKWRTEQAPAKVDEIWQRTALDGTYGRLACICWAVDDGPVETAVLDDEKMMLQLLLQQRNGTINVCAHNAPFDLGFIRKRAVIHGVRLPFWWPSTINPWDQRIRDTQYLLAGRGEYITLKRLCKALGIASDDDVDGADVHRLWEAGERERVVRHCIADVERVREINRRLKAVGI